MVTDNLAVETVGLVKRFPKQPGWRNLFRKGDEKVAVAGVDLAVRRGETLGLLGPNGAGKTTLVKILCTLITPTSGVARVGGLDVQQHESEVRRRIGLVYGDQRSFFWRLSLLENLRFYAALQRLSGQEARRRIDQMLDEVELTEAAHVRMHYFSSGMKQRAAIARGLLSDPEIIFLDEPTTSVDPVHSFEIRKMIRERIASDRRRTVILTTNDMDEAEFLCDRLALLNHGRIELAGDISMLRERFQPDEAHLVTVSGVSEPDLWGLHSIPGVLDLMVSETAGSMLELRLKVRRDSAAIPEVVRYLVGRSASVWSCVKQELSLDEMFRLAFGTRGTGDALPRSEDLELAGRPGR